MGVHPACAPHLPNAATASAKHLSTPSPAGPAVHHPPLRLGPRHARRRPVGPSGRGGRALPAPLPGAAAGRGDSCGGEAVLPAAGPCCTRCARRGHAGGDGGRHPGPHDDSALRPGRRGARCQEAGQRGGGAAPLHPVPAARAARRAAGHRRAGAQGAISHAGAAACGLPRRATGAKLPAY